MVAPTNRDGDTVGTKLNEDGSITTAPGFAEAYGKLVESGWNGIGFPEVYGGGGFPQLLSTAVEEMTTTANMALRWARCSAGVPSRRSCITATRARRRSTSRSSSAVNGPAR